MRVGGHVCKLGQEVDLKNHCQVKWVLSYPRPCECTEIIMGGGSLKWPPKRSYEPVLVDDPLESDDIHEIRRYYGLQCNNSELAEVKSKPCNVAFCCVSPPIFLLNHTKFGYEIGTICYCRVVVQLCIFGFHAIFSFTFSLFFSLSLSHFT